MSKLIALAALIAICTCAALAPAAEVAANQETNDSMFRDVPKEHIEFLTAFKKEHEEFFAAWAKLREKQERVLELVDQYGTKVDRELEQTRAEARLLESTVQKTYRSLRTPLDQKVTELKEEAFKLNQKGDSGNARADKKRDDALTRLYADTEKYASQANALGAMYVIVQGKIRNIATKAQRAGIDRHDEAAAAVARANPGIVDARLAIRNLQADIKALKAGKQDSELTRDDKRAIAAAEAQIQNSIQELERIIARATKPLERDLARLEKKVDRAKKNFEAAKKRKRSVERYESKYREEQEAFDTVKEKLDVYKKLATWQETEKKAR